MSFRVGQKVVCVDDVAHGNYSPFPRRPDLEGLKKGAVYTIRYSGVRLGVPVVRLYEIRREKSRVLDNEENAYAAVRFRPVNDRPTDISVFTEMLDSLETT